ncbi:MAG: aminopeptidase [Myxococcales bacterium]|nr:aminopeptidase [Myxococcales bacterium]
MIDYSSVVVRAAVCTLLVALSACKERREPVPAPPTGSGSSGSATPAVASRRDPHSLSNPEQIVVTHLSLHLSVDFTTKILTGKARLTLAKREPSASTVILDTDGLSIDTVTDCTTAQPVPSTTAPVVKRLGQALTITPASDCVAIAYRTSPAAKALLWVDPAGTAGKKQPMLFTQSQAILARTWIPLQDTPGVRFTYDATIVVPQGVRPVMSAENPSAPLANGSWEFRMTQPIPSYLMALAVGDLAFQPIGERTGVYAEPSIVEAAAREFAEVDAMIAAAEKLYGPYRWGRYDILVLPPSFPFGGMENPRLTFLTPTVITGDRALVGLIAHELAHSWSGNLVTNSTWNDTWLNEGFTTYVERRIMEALRGTEHAEMAWANGRKDLDKALAEMGRTNLDSRLALDWGTERDPDDIVSEIAYDKGALLLHAMELAFGRDTFDAFLRARFDRLAFQSSDTKTFEADAAPLFKAKDPGWTLAEWLHQPGLPATAPPTTSARLAALEAEAVAFATTGTLPAAKDWKTTEWLAFLGGMPKDTTRERLLALDATYKLTASTNALIAMSWLPVLIQADVREAAPTVDAYLVRVGRRWLVRTVYTAMIAKNDFWRAHAAAVFEKAKAGYHPVTRDTIAEMLAPTKPADR